MAADEEKKSDDRLVKIELDDAGMPRRSAEAEQERAIAIYDLLEANIFRLTTVLGHTTFVCVLRDGMCILISVK